ncbi:MAG: cadmium-translocating P-type ATPase [Lactobacillales bacterium]|jgi:Cd2+/Zn2+-exporting ATPase|nr:cadmium-translocating P-type ATPase [Lactobacillales bacterium]
MESLKKTSTYKIDGLSCSNCAAKFEKNVVNIPEVVDAKVNFGASKISITGSATIEEIEQAGAFENLKISLEGSEKKNDNRNNLEILKDNWYLFVSAGFILAAFASQTFIGEKSPLTVGLFLVAIVIGGYQLFIEGIKDLVKLDFTMETLMTIAIIGAALIGEWSEGAVVVILFAISEMLEQFSMDKARQSIQTLMNVAPKEALIRRSGIEKVLPVDEIRVGDIMLIKPGQKIAMDGVVVKGSSSVNQAAITGESVPVEKTFNDTVFASTLNEEGILEVEVTKRVEDTTIAKIIQLVEEAQGERAPAQAFVETFAKYYTPIIMAIAALVIVVPPLFFGGEWNKWIYQGLSILVVGCPCALVISTPISIVSAIGNAAKNGLLVKGGIYLEEVGNIQAIAFDKTGTLTKGKPVMTDYLVADEVEDKESLFNLLAALESYSQHPLATSILEEANKHQIDSSTLSIEDFQSITGKGIQGTINGVTYFIGSPKLFSEKSLETESTLSEKYKVFQKQGKTAILFGTKDKLLAVVAVADEVRSSSHEVIEKLKNIGIQHTIMLTGDNKETAEYIGKQVGVSEVRGELMPQDKLDSIKELQAKYGKVAMIGDGVNDAPALATSNVGIAMGGAGTDTALETADIALMGDDLTKLPFLVKLSRKTLAIIKQNISFAIGIKVLALLLVIPGWLTLWIAIVADMGATIIVTLNGIRLMRVKDK